MPEPTLRRYDGFRHGSPALHAAVRRLQKRLNAHGMALTVDGYFGHATEGAVIRFQRSRALTPDGVAGPMTWAALRGNTEPEPGYARNDPALLAELPLAARYRAAIESGADRAGVSPALVCGIGSRESRWGLALVPPGPAGTGDALPRGSRKPWREGDLPPDGGGFGRGLMQIDFDAHAFARTGNWRDPGANIDYGCKVLRGNRLLLRRRTGLAGDALLRAAVAAYNCGAGNVLKALERGRDVDHFTSGRDYARDVLDRADWFQGHGW